MIATWMLSALVFTALVGGAAWSAEIALRASRRPTRWPWLVALAASVTWPVLVPIARRLIPADGMLQSVATTLPTIQVVPDQLPVTTSWTQSLDVALLVLWMVASVIVFARLVRALVLLARIRRASEPCIVDGVAVLVSANLGPAVVGVRQPAVLLPVALLGLEEPLRRLVLRHEEEHRRARDPWIVLGSAFAVALTPWNLPLWWLTHRARLALEVDCDARVLAAESNATQYGKLLLLISQQQRITALAPMLAASTSHLERRIAAMLPIRSTRRRVRIAVALVATVIAGIAACTSRIGDGIAGPKPVIGARSADVNPDQPYFEFQVNKAAQQIPGSGNLQYPDVLRAANVSGVVLVQFVIDENGAVVPGTFKVLKSDHALFAKAVENALPTMRFRAAELRGTKVKQLVQQPFAFSLSSSETSSPTRFAVVLDSGGRRQARASASAERPYFELKLDKQAAQIPGTGGLHYPAILAKAGVTGEVVAQFVVDANGEFVPGTLRVIKSDHELFTQSVAEALPTMRFEAAEVRGSKVKQMISQTFTFSSASPRRRPD